MYYQLKTDGLENVHMKKKRGLNSHIELAMGKSWDIEKDNITLPYKYSMRVAVGAEPRFYGWYPGSDLMQTRLVDVLKASGVDNLQIFPAEVWHNENIIEVPGFVSVSIVGRVSCVDMKESEGMPIANSIFFTKLVIDPSKANGQLMFRVHESPMIVLVHEKVAEAIDRGKFIGLKLEPI